MISEQEYVISRFFERFEAFKNYRIMLHGSRNYAAAIIKEFDSQFNFIGIMTNDPYEEEEFCGKKIMSISDLTKDRVDMIILTERVKYAEAAYKQLHKLCEQQGILLYNMYGLDEIQTHADVERHSHLDTEAMKEKAGLYDIVGFEVMDTFLFTDLFHLEPAVRADSRELYDSLRKRGIPVYFSLRKSLPAEQQIPYLEKANLFETTEELHEHLIYRTGEDLSFRALRERFPDKKILYIGTGLVYECLLPKCYGIDTVRGGTIGIFDDMLFAAGGQRQPKDALKSVEGKESRGEALCQKIIKEMEEAEIVSFDVFDTLILRKTLYPQDVFELVQKKKCQSGKLVEEILPDYVRLRKQAEQDLPFAALQDIYIWLQKETELPEQICMEIMGLELQEEEEVLSARNAVVELLEEAIRKGKQVVLTSDMYIPGKEMDSLLSKIGIRGYKKLFVSCDYGVSKSSGLFREVVEWAGTNRILHIGDNMQADVLAAESFGIHGIHLPSALQLALENNWMSALKKAENLSERCLMGISIAKAFENPFQAGAILELGKKEQFRRYAVGAAGPVIMGYLTWMIKEAREMNIEKILFFARDGYLPFLYYTLLKKKYDNDMLPEAVYFYANRHSSLIGAQNGVDDAFFVSKTGRGQGLSPEDILFNMYDLQREQIEPMKEGETISAYIMRHSETIQKRRDQARRGYERYIRKLGIEPEGKYAVVDFVASGTTQLLLEKFLPYRFQGLYFGNPYYNLSKTEHIHYYLQGHNPYLLKNFMEMECFMTSPEPSLNYIDENGEAVFQQEVRSAETISAVQEVHREIMAYAEEYIKLFYQKNDLINADLVEELYAADGIHGVLQQSYDDWVKVSFQIGLDTFKNAKD